MAARKYSKQQIEEAKRRRQKEGVYGIRTTQELLDLGPNFMILNKQERADVVRRLAIVANKRLHTLIYNTPDTSPSLLQWQKEGSVQFTAKGKDVNQLAEEYMRLRNFLNQKTSTRTGFEEFKREYKKRTGLDWGSKTSNLFWAVYATIKERHPSLLAEYGSTQVQIAIYITIETVNTTDLLVLADKVYDKLHGIIEEDDDLYNFDDSFDLGPNI